MEERRKPLLPSGEHTPCDRLDEGIHIFAKISSAVGDFSRRAIFLRLVSTASGA